MAEFLLENLKQLCLYYINLPQYPKSNAGEVARDVNLLKALLTNSPNKRRKDEPLRESIHQIRDVLYEAEDIIDTYVIQADRKSRASLHAVAQNLRYIQNKVRYIIDYYRSRLLEGVEDGRPEPEPWGKRRFCIRHENVVGFEDEAEKIIGYLTEKTSQLDVISVIGMPGLGKTTLAWKIFHDKRIQSEFPTRIWVYVTNVFTKKDVCLAILRKFIDITEETRQKRDEELAWMASTYLEKGKFLIVMDDVWTANDWDKIQTVLPKTESDGKVLVTSCHAEVAQRANYQREPHNLRFLTSSESWLLLQYEVFGKPEFPPELEIWGNGIADQCDGLPLAIVAIGDILFNQLSSSNMSSALFWKKVSKNVKTYLQEDLEMRIEKVFAFRYEELPYHLQACFLYIGMFPEDFEIPVRKLIRMWIAEGFIQQEDDSTMEETAENYLNELINRNLVRVDKRRWDGRVKTCRINVMLGNFCKYRAGNENFLQELKWKSKHSNVLPFLLLKPTGREVRSLVCFSKEGITLPSECTTVIPAGVKLIRVLDVKPITFCEIPSDIYQLEHLRYITLSFNSNVLPLDFAKLRNLETLIVDTSCPTLDIKVNIWRMNRLRHLKTNATAILNKPGKIGKESGNLQTLGNISAQSCVYKIFNKVRNLKELGIRGKLSSLPDGKIGSFTWLEKLGSLEKLKLQNDVLPTSEAVLLSKFQFPPNLKSLTLSGTFLDWSQMSILATLNLKVLKLKDNAFVGMFWEPKDEGFQCLEILYIESTDLTFWTPLDHHYPKNLKCLELRNCEKLLEIPIGLASIPTFQVLKLYHSNKAITAAENIEKAKQQNNLTHGKFKLSIFPPPVSA